MRLGVRAGQCHLLLKDAHWVTATAACVHQLGVKVVAVEGPEEWVTGAPSSCHLTGTARLPPRREVWTHLAVEVQTPWQRVTVTLAVQPWNVTSSCTSFTLQTSVGGGTSVSRHLGAPTCGGALDPPPPMP